MATADNVNHDLSSDLVIKVKYRKLNEQNDSEDDITLTIETRQKPLYKRFIDPHHWIYRCIIQCIICYLLFSIYYCFESPGGLEDTIIKVMDIDTTQYSLLFSVSSWPSVILCLLGGPLTDRLLGRRLSCIILAISITIGQCVWSIGGYVKIYWIMLVGRFLIGLGVMLLTAVLKSITVLWFRGTDMMAFALSLGVTSARSGGAVALSIPQLIYSHLNISNNYTRLGTTILIGAFLMIIGLLLLSLLILMDKRGERILQRNELKVTAKIKCNELKQFSIGFWLVAFIATIYYPVVFSFTSIGEVFYIQKYGLSLISSGIVVSFVFSATVILTPLMGLIVDIIGYHVIWVITGLITALISHLMLLTSDGQASIPYISGVIYSISYTIISASLWALPGLLIDTSQVATAYSIILSPYMLLFAILSLVSGTIVDYAGYFILETSYSLLICTALLAGLLLWYIDSVLYKETIINSPGKLMKKFNEKIRFVLQKLKHKIK